MLIILATIVGLVIADAGARYERQSSGYEEAENSQPRPAPISASGGDQQAYNSDGAGGGGGRGGGGGGRGAGRRVFPSTFPRRSTYIKLQNPSGFA
ncbi:unnamed protein product [Cylicocyclus nassatus]|uniref:Uncharacterized protein n=1 Tax=Cylicocyclus nassatus TaxID=53992 RepID=A0AA36DLR8_CYLNA|nr:unnamed protein product [Cylicocyclus nassatus]